MRKLLLASVATIGLFACSTPVNPTLVQDGNLAVAALQALDADAVALGAPAADTAGIGLAITALQTGLTDLQKGSQTPADFAALADDEISQLAPVLLADFRANATITTGVTLLEGLLPLIAADVTATTSATAAAAPRVTDPRQKLQAWVNGQRK